MSALKTLALMVATAVSVAACATTGTTAGSGRDLFAGSDEPETMVRVENRNWSDVDVFAVYGGIRRRLGTVTSMTSARFRIPSDLLAAGRDLQLLADPIGSSEAYLTPAVQVYSGQEVSFTVQNHMSLSSIAVFNRRP